MLEEAYSRKALGQRWFCIVQKYLEKPFLVNYLGNMVKMDLRIWVCALNWNPLVAVCHKHTYFRLCTKPFGFRQHMSRQDGTTHLSNRTMQDEDSHHHALENDPDFQWSLE